MSGLDLSEDRSEKQWLKQHRNSFFLPHKSLVWGILCHWQPGLLTDFDFTVTRVWLLTSCWSEQEKERGGRKVKEKRKEGKKEKGRLRQRKERNKKEGGREIKENEKGSKPG